jgi:hypothetical protein
MRCMMVRKQVYLEERQDALLKERARQLGVTEAELIRRALDRALTEPSGLLRSGAFQELLEQAGERRRLPVDPRRREWRREELYDA